SAGQISANPFSLSCPGQPFDLSSSGVTVGAGVTYQWQSRPTGAGAFTDILGATNTNYSVSNFSGDTDYRLVVVCTHSNSTDISNEITVLQPASVGNFSEDFDTTATGTTSAPSVPTCWSYIDDIAST